LGQLF